MYHLRADCHGRPEYYQLPEHRSVRRHVLLVPRPRLQRRGRFRIFQYGERGDAEHGSPGTDQLTATAISSTQINLTWTDNATNETGFRIERCQGAGCTSFTQLANVGPNATALNNFGLAPSSSYSYRVRAFNGSGDSEYSDTATAVTPAPSPVRRRPISPRRPSAPRPST